MLSIKMKCIMVGYFAGSSVMAAMYNDTIVSFCCMTFALAILSRNKKEMIINV